MRSAKKRKRVAEVVGARVPPAAAQRAEGSSKLTLVDRRAAQYAKHNEEFLQTFNVPLAKFWCRLAGLRIADLDEQVVCSNGGSVLDMVREKFGDNAVLLVKALL